jgi:hypothetical protein
MCETQPFQMHIHTDFFHNFIVEPYCKAWQNFLFAPYKHIFITHLNKATLTHNAQCISSTRMKTQHLAAAYNIDMKSLL